jgi:hypothetical protein
MEKDYLILKRAAVSRPSGPWSDDDFDVLANGEVVGRIYKANAAPVGTPWMWTLAFGHHEGRSPTHGYEPTREDAMAAFAKSWRREWALPLFDPILFRFSLHRRCCRILALDPVP